MQNCESTRFQIVEDTKICHDYQEIKIQESTQVLGVGAIPRSIPVILKDDLVDIVKAGGTHYDDLIFFTCLPGIFQNLHIAKEVIPSPQVCF